MQPFDQRISIVILSALDRLEMKETGASLARRPPALTTALHVFWWVAPGKTFLSPSRNGFARAEIAREGLRRPGGSECKGRCWWKLDGWRGVNVKGQPLHSHAVCENVWALMSSTAVQPSVTPPPKKKTFLWNIMTPEFDQILQLCFAQKNSQL